MSEETKSDWEQDEERIKNFLNDASRYTAQIEMAKSLNNFIKSLEAQKEHAEKVLKWVQADEWRDGAISILLRRMNELEAKFEKLNSQIRVDVKHFDTWRFNHTMDDFDWTQEVGRMRKIYNNLNVRFMELDKEHKLLMTKILEGEI